MSMPDPGFGAIPRIEAIEREAMADLYAAASPGIASAFGLQQRALADGLLLVNRRVPNFLFNRVLSLGISGFCDEHVFDEIIATFAENGIADWAIQLAPGASALEHVLRRRGFAPHPRVWAKFVYASGTPDTARSEIAIRELGTADASAFGSVVADAFHLPPDCAPWIARLVGRTGWRVFGGFAQDELIAGGAVFVANGSSWVGLGATRSAYRGRGAQSAILTARIRAAREAGAELITTETGIPHPGEAGPSYNNIQRAGFRIIYERPNYRRA